MRSHRYALSEGQIFSRYSTHPAILDHWQLQVETAWRTKDGRLWQLREPEGLRSAKVRRTEDRGTSVEMRVGKCGILAGD